MKTAKRFILWIINFITQNAFWDRFGFEFKKGIIYDIILLDATFIGLFIWYYPTLEKYYSLSVSFLIALKKALAFIGAFFLMVTYYNKFQDKMKPDQRLALSAIIVISLVLFILESKKKIEVRSTFA